MDVNTAIMLLSILIICLFYSAISGRYFASPYKIMGMGLFFVLFSFLYKFILVKILHSSQYALDAAPFIDMSTAALGGNLIASAIVIKAQKEHNRTKNEAEQSIVYNSREVERLRSALSTIAAREHLMPKDEYTKLLANTVKGIMTLDAQIKKLEQERDNLNLL